MQFYSMIGNGNCLLHAILIAMVGIHDFHLYLRDRLHQFMNDNDEQLKAHWKTERIRTDRTYGIQSEDSNLDKVCQIRFRRMINNRHCLGME
jgi:hypothetical protein